MIIRIFDSVIFMLKIILIFEQIPFSSKHIFFVSIAALCDRQFTRLNINSDALPSAGV